MMRTQHLIGGIAALALAGCAGDPIKLHALEGPLAAANPGLVLGARNEGGGNTGRFSYVLPDGATCNGQWQRVSNVLKRRDALPVKNDGMVQSHGSIKALGEGNTIAHRARKAAIEGSGTCSTGATFEFASVADGHSGRGALRDSNGNIFRITMR